MKAVVARTALFTVLTFIIGVHTLGRGVRRFLKKPNKRPNRIVMIGTFYNQGWFYAHVGPLVKCPLVDEVLVVCDEPVKLELDNVSFHCPSPQLIARVGRGAARILTLLRVGWRLRPQVYMGYHIFPNGPLALLAAGLFGGKALYQMTGGPNQVIHGGYLSENPLLRATGGPSRVQEMLVFSLVRRFDAVVVRGSKAREFVHQRRLNKNCFVITGAIDTDKFKPGDEKDIDVIYVSRLVEKKGVENYLEVLTLLCADKPNLKAGIIGDGPLRASLEQTVESTGIKNNVQFHGKLLNVAPVLSRSKVFVLLSPSEGMSIAMLEAMAAGLPVVVTDVGDLSDVIAGKGGGVLLQKMEPAQAAADIAGILDDEEVWNQCSRAARQTILAECSVQAIAERWQRELQGLLT